MHRLVWRPWQWICLVQAEAEQSCCARSLLSLQQPCKLIPASLIYLMPPETMDHNGFLSNGLILVLAQHQEGLQVAFGSILP